MMIFAYCPGCDKTLSAMYTVNLPRISAHSLYSNCDAKLLNYLRLLLFNYCIRLVLSVIKVIKLNEILTPKLNKNSDKNEAIVYMSY